MVGKHAGAIGACIGAVQLLDQIVTVEDVVAQHQRAGVVADKVPSDDEGLRQAVGAGLDRVPDVHAPLVAVAQQVRKVENAACLGPSDDALTFLSHGIRIIEHE
jgi:hypothetical protein